MRPSKTGIFKPASQNTDTPEKTAIQSLLVANVMATWHRLMKMARPYQPGALGSSRPGRRRSSVKKKAAAIRVKTVGKAMLKPVVTSSRLQAGSFEGEKPISSHQRIMDCRAGKVMRPA